MVATDMGKKKRRPRGLVRTSLTTEDRDLEQSSAEYKGEYRASLIQQGQGEEKVSAISSDHRRKQDDKKSSNPPSCNYGLLCKWNAKGLCKFDHSRDKSWILCRYARDGKKCKRQEEGSCIFAQHPKQQLFGKRTRVDDQDTADDSQKRQSLRQTSTNEFPFDRDVRRTDDDGKSESDSSSSAGGGGRRFSQQQHQQQQQAAATKKWKTVAVQQRNETTAAA